MFKIPKWEDDVPKSNVAFDKPANAKKEKSINTNSSINNPKENVEKLDKKRKRLKKTKSNEKSNNNHYVMAPQTLKTKNIAVVRQESTKDKVSRKRKHNDNTNKIQVKSPEKKSKAKKRKVNNTEGNPPEVNKNVNIMNNVLNGDSAQSTEDEVKPVQNKLNKKKEKLKKLLQIETNRNHINVSGNNLRQRMLERLKAAQFRFLNEKLYTTSGTEAQKLFQSDPDAFNTYHQGYQQQLKKWPVNPLDLIVKRISKMPKSHMVADMGCGEASLSRRVHQKVRSFDLVASAAGVEACDMARTPLLAASTDVAVYCLALMGTDLTQYLVEANRVLKVGGHLLIAEVESRFDNVESFTDDVQRLGFKLKNLDKSHQVFFFMEFTKVRDPPAKKSKLPTLSLKPCFYKKR